MAGGWGSAADSPVKGPTGKYIMESRIAPIFRSPRREIHCTGIETDIIEKSQYFNII